jgi:AraC-like DNA-binding protein
VDRDEQFGVGCVRSTEGLKRGSEEREGKGPLHGDISGIPASGSSVRAELRQISDLVAVTPLPGDREGLRGAGVQGMLLRAIAQASRDLEHAAGTVANDARCSLRSARTTLQDLEGLGFINIIRCARRHEPNLWRIASLSEVQGFLPNHAARKRGRRIGGELARAMVGRCDPPSLRFAGRVAACLPSLSGDGLPASTIATRCGLSPTTVRKVLRHLQGLTVVGSTRELVTYKREFSADQLELFAFAPSMRSRGRTSTWEERWHLLDKREWRCA